MKNVILILVLAAAIIAAFYLLSWWASVTLLLGSIVALACKAWHFLSPSKAVNKAGPQTFAQAIPQKRLCSLAAGEEFRGGGFTFKFPMACDVHQVALDSREALGLKPHLRVTGWRQDWLLLISTLSQEELKAKVMQRLKEACVWFQKLHPGAFVPVQIGSLHGEQQTLKTIRKGKPIRGESVYLSHGDFSIAWNAIGPADASGALVEQFRALVCLIERTPLNSTAAPPCRHSIMGSAENQGSNP